MYKLAHIPEDTTPLTPAYSSTLTPTYSSTLTPTYSSPPTPAYSSTLTRTYSSPPTPAYSSTLTPTYSSPPTPAYSNLLQPTPVPSLQPTPEEEHDFKTSGYSCGISSKIMTSLHCTHSQYYIYTCTFILYQLQCMVEPCMKSYVNWNYFIMSPHELR